MWQLRIILSAQHLASSTWGNRRQCSDSPLFALASSQMGKYEEGIWALLNKSYSRRP